jgi:hypothetical protein
MSEVYSFWPAALCTNLTTILKAMFGIPFGVPLTTEDVEDGT